MNCLQCSFVKNSLMKFFSLVLLFCISFSIQAQISALPEGFKIVNTCEATEVKSQDRTGTCWSFSTSSFLESEVLKEHGRTVDISEMFTVRNIYLEKAILYIRYHGISNFSQGSLAHDVLYSYEKYGMMPESAYSGKNGSEYHDHSNLVKELKAYLDTILSKPFIDPHWKDGFVSILDKQLGEVKAVFEYEGNMYNSKSFASQVLQLDMDNYIGLTSFNHHEYYDDFVVEVPDNFSQGEYDNIPLDELMAVMNNALQNGYTVEWDGDVSEIGFMRRGGFAFLNNDTNALKTVPEELPIEETVTQSSRQVMFDNHSTTDDHLMHITGLAEGFGKRFYVVKNSWGSKAGFNGYYLMSEEYIKAKTVSIVVNKLAVNKKILKKLDD